MTSRDSRVLFAYVSFRLQSFWNVDNSWDKLKAEFDNDYMTNLDEFLRSELAHGFYPPAQDIFKAFDATARHGQGRDPRPGPVFP
jgi:hypothetical protein